MAGILFLLDRVGIKVKSWYKGILEPAELCDHGQVA